VSSNWNRNRFTGRIPKVPSNKTRKKQGFVIPTKSFVKIGIKKIFLFQKKKMFSYTNKTFGCCSKIFGWSVKKLFVVPNFVAVTKPFFSVIVAITTLVCGAWDWVNARRKNKRRFRPLRAVYKGGTDDLQGRHTPYAYHKYHSHIWQWEKRCREKKGGEVRHCAAPAIYMRCQ